MWFEIPADDNEEEKEFKEITENPIILDFSQCKYWLQVHEVLKEKFCLPEYYGKNWDALWDCLRDRFEPEDNFEIRICGYHTMPENWQQACLKMFKIFDRVQDENPNIKFIFTD